jgi:hypothetical protein
MKVSIAALKAAFGLGKKPTEGDFGNIFDSFVHIDNQAAVDGQIVDQKLNAYAQSQQSGNANGKVDTVGDLYSIFIGVDDKPGFIKTYILDKLGWSALPGRPTALDLAWTEQLITTDMSVFDPQPSQTPTSANTANNPASSFLLAGLGKLPVAGSYLIKDIQIRRQWTSQPNAYMDVITAVKVAYQPRATT